MFSNDNSFRWSWSYCPHLLYNTAFFGPLGIGPYRYFVFLFFIWCLFYYDSFSLKRVLNKRKQRKLKKKSNRKKKENRRQKKKKKKKKKKVTCNCISYSLFSYAATKANTIEKIITLKRTTINNFLQWHYKKTRCKQEK